MNKNNYEPMHVDVKIIFAVDIEDVEFEYVRIYNDENYFGVYSEASNLLVLLPHRNISMIEARYCYGETPLDV